MSTNKTIEETSYYAIVITKNGHGYDVDCKTFGPFETVSGACLKAHEEGVLRSKNLSEGKYIITSVEKNTKICRTVVEHKVEKIF